MAENKTEKIFRYIFALLAVFYAVALVKVTFFKDGVRLGTSAYRLVPFYDLYQYKMGLKSANSLAVNYLGNIALFFPAGIFLPIFFKRLKFAKVTILGLLLSVSVEILQYVTSRGYLDADDVIMNTFGTALGAITYFYILRGKKRTVLSYVLSFILIFALEAGSLVCAWRFAPNLLPQDMIVVGGRIAGRRIDEFDVRVKCYKLSHGDVFSINNTAEDSSGRKLEKTERTYRFSDTAVFAVQTEQDGKKTYRILGIDEIIDEVSKQGSSYVRLWLGGNGRCEIAVLEQTK